MKFKVGDKVRVKANDKLLGGRYAGWVGEVTFVDKGVTYPYNVRFSDNDNSLFHANKLERVE